MAKEPTDNLYRLFVQIMKLSFSYAFPQFHELKMHPAQAELLCILHQHSGITQAALAKILCIAPSTVAISLNRLEEAGYVYREKGKDKRKSLVFLSEKGSQVVDIINQIFSLLDQRFTCMLSPEEIAMLSSLLHKIRDGLAPEHLHECPLSDKDALIAEL